MHGELQEWKKSFYSLRQAAGSSPHEEALENRVDELEAHLDHMEQKYRKLVQAKGQLKVELEMCTMKLDKKTKRVDELVEELNVTRT